MEMIIKAVALGIVGHEESLFSNNWNKFDVFIICGEVLDHFLASLGILSGLRVFSAMRLIGRVPSMRVLVTDIINTLPMLANVFVLYIFVIHIFSVMGVQMWAGQLRNRCFLGEEISTKYNISLSQYYVTKYGEKSPFICSPKNKNGMRHCRDVPPSTEGEVTCRAGDHNPQKDAISFDNIGFAWIAIFQAITLEGWTEIMYYVMDANSFWSFVFFILVTIPKELTDVLWISNIVFVLIFVVEMILKLLAVTWAYFKDRNNVFDFIIIIISLLGMYQFGCKFSFKTVNGDTITDRKNFDSLLWSMVTVFQILTEEDWNIVLYNAMSATSPWSALYFVALIILGKLVILNVLLGIAVKSYRAKDSSSTNYSLSCENDVSRTDNEEHVLALGLLFGKKSYCRSSWNIMDGSLVILSLVHIIVSLVNTDKDNMLGIVKVLRLLRVLRPLRVIKRAPRLKLAVEALIASVKPIGNIVLICGAFFFFGILGVQLFKGKFHHCVGRDIRAITNMSECLLADYQWERKTFNFDNLPQALMSLFVMYSKDGWVNIMYDGLDAVGVHKQYVLKLTEYSYYVFTAILIVEVLLKIVSFSALRFMKNRWNLLDVAVVVVSIVSIIFTEMKMVNAIPVNTSILRVCRVLRLTQVLKAKKIRVLLEVIIKMLSQDTLRECRPGDHYCVSYLSWVSPIFFTSFVIIAQFVLVNLVVAAIMQALEDSNKNNPTNFCLTLEEEERQEEEEEEEKEEKGEDEEEEEKEDKEEEEEKEVKEEEGENGGER
ncbi:hypothetical protein PAMP_016150 [Pampus punctatissimus]